MRTATLPGDSVAARFSCALNLFLVRAEADTTPPMSFLSRDHDDVNFAWTVNAGDEDALDVGGLARAAD